MTSSAITAITITLDDRLRLMTAALAATSFPEMAQKRRRHYAHAHARATFKYMQDHGYKNHAAAVALQSLLDQNTPLEALFTLVMQFEPDGFEVANPPRWMPAGWNRQLWDFFHTARLRDYWESSRTPWDNARSQVEKVFASTHFKAFLLPFLGDIQEDFLFMPNIGYPADDEISIRAGDRLIAIIPPPQAWGDSPPWAYDEMVQHTYRAALMAYGRLLLTAYLRANAEKVQEASKKDLPVTDQFRALHPNWEDQFVALFLSAAVAMYLEEHVSQAEAKAYLVMEKKARGMAILPATINVLHRYLKEKGNRYHTLADFLNVFPAQLRVANKIVTM
ncbi:MAG: hypothetical protein MUE40_09200 [Anaerolineae bacterium]|jgi:hypothetical protein|nr:hypothetical protein [Anaerolineae bacterium]